MKNIELREDHKSKLLEMCKELFPESKIKFNDDYYTACDLFLMSNDDDDEINLRDYVNCHWFEFCMTHLSTKIDSFKNDSYLICNGQSYDNAINSNHPIDYLYEEFKKTKINV